MSSFTGAVLWPVVWWNTDKTLPTGGRVLSAAHAQAVFGGSEMPLQKTSQLQMYCV